MLVSVIVPEPLVVKIPWMSPFDWIRIPKPFVFHTGSPPRTLGPGRMEASSVTAFAGDIPSDPDILARLEQFYSAVALQIEKRCGLMAMPLMQMSSEGCGRMVLTCGRLVVINKVLRDKQTNAKLTINKALDGLTLTLEEKADARQIANLLSTYIRSITVSSESDPSSLILRQASGGVA